MTKLFTLLLVGIALGCAVADEDAANNDATAIDTTKSTPRFSRAVDVLPITPDTTKASTIENEQVDPESLRFNLDTLAHRFKYHESLYEYEVVHGEEVDQLYLAGPILTNSIFQESGFEPYDSGHGIWDGTYLLSVESPEHLKAGLKAITVVKKYGFHTLRIYLLTYDAQGKKISQCILAESYADEESHQIKGKAINDSLYCTWGSGNSTAIGPEDNEDNFLIDTTWYTFHANGLIEKHD